MYPTIVPQENRIIVGQAIREARTTAEEVHTKRAVAAKPNPERPAVGRVRRGAAKALISLGRRIAGTDHPRPAHRNCDDAVRAG